MSILRKVLLVRLFNPIFKQIKHPLHCYPPISLKYIQVMLEHKLGLSTKFIDAWALNISTQEVISRACAFIPDCLIAYIERPGERGPVEQLIKGIDNKRLLKIALGPDISTRLDDYTDKDSQFDLLVTGEPEQEIAAFFTNLLQNPKKKDEILRQYSKTNLNGNVNIVQDLDTLGIIKFSKKEISSYPFIYPLKLSKKIMAGYLMTSRGCPHHCKFCSPIIRKSYGKNLRLRGISIVIQEIEQLLSQGVNFISFEDDNFGASLVYLNKLCKAIIEKKLQLKWAAQIRADADLRHDLLINMKKSGCILLQAGVESGSQRIISSLKKTEAVSCWSKHCTRLFNRINSHGIAICALFIIGSLDETEKEINQSIELAKKLNPDFIKVHFFNLYPGSEIYHNPKYNSKAIKNDNAHHHYAPNINLCKIENSKLIKLRKHFYNRFFFRPHFILSHIKKYAGYYLFNPKVFALLLKKMLNLS